MSTNFFERTQMVEFTNNSTTISGTEGFKKISVRVLSTSLANATISGEQNSKIGSLNVTNITIYPSDVIDIGSCIMDIDGITIAAPANCTVQIIGSKYTNII